MSDKMLKVKTRDRTVYIYGAKIEAFEVDKGVITVVMTSGWATNGGWRT